MMNRRQSTVAQRRLRTAQAVALCWLVLILAFTALPALPARAEVPFTPKLHAFVHSMFPRLWCFSGRPAMAVIFIIGAGERMAAQKARQRFPLAAKGVKNYKTCS